jgi:methionyl-tRNA synthetase
MRRHLDRGFTRIDLRSRDRQANRWTGPTAARRDLGGERRTVFAGIRQAYEPQKLVGRLTVVVANLEPRKMRFGLPRAWSWPLTSGATSSCSPRRGAQPGMKVK